MGMANNIMGSSRKLRNKYWFEAELLGVLCVQVAAMRGIPVSQLMDRKAGGVTLLNFS